MTRDGDLLLLAGNMSQVLPPTPPVQPGQGANPTFSHDHFSGTASEATMEPFVIDSFEVTNARFAAFANAFEAWRGIPGKHPALNEGADPALYDVVTQKQSDCAGLNSCSGWRSEWNAKLPNTRAELCSVADNAYGIGKETCACSPDTPASCSELVPTLEQRSHPVMAVSWIQAMAFCIWDGGRLPTSAEWDFVYSSGKDQNRWPWGSMPDVADKNGATVPPASYQKGPYHMAGNDPTGMSRDFVPAGNPSDIGKGRVFDLLGSVREFLLDSDTLGVCTTPPCKNPVAIGLGPLTLERRMIRGGTSANPISNFVPVGVHSPNGFSGVLSDPVKNTGLGIGFRCARRSSGP